MADTQSLSPPRPPALPSWAPPERLPRRRSDSHKGTYGRVLLVGGSRGMAGSISLSAVSALRCGSGLVTVAVPDRCLETVAGFNPCLMTRPLPDCDSGEFAPAAIDVLAPLVEAVDACAVGPGMQRGGGASRIVERLLAHDTPRVFDADALNVMSSLSDVQGRLGGACVLTPHPGEWQRISGVAAGDRGAQRQAARRFAADSGAVILLKGPATFVTDGDQDYTNRTGNPGMATAGSGDCLTGVIAALLGCGLNPWRAAVLGAWIHGVAGDLAAQRLGMAGVIATDIAEHLPWAVELATESPSHPMPGEGQSP